MVKRECVLTTESQNLKNVLFLEKQECGNISYVKLRVVKKQT
jgi:hypothetical protein